MLSRGRTSELRQKVGPVEPVGAHIYARTPKQRRLQVACGYGGRGGDNLARYSSASFESYATLVELIICTLAQG